jgi:VCBS repeat-containing protein
MSTHDQNKSKNITSIDARVENPDIAFDTSLNPLAAFQVDQKLSDELLTTLIDSDKPKEEIDAAISRALSEGTDGIQVAAISASTGEIAIDTNVIDVDTNYNSDYNSYASGGGGASGDGMSPVLVVGLGALALGGIAAALGGSSSSGSSSNPVNVDPQFDPSTPTTLNTNEDSSTQFTVAASDANSSDVLTYSTTNGANGTVSPVAGTTDRFTYTPNPNFNGQDTFTITVSDGNGGTVSQTITVNVAPVNDAPELASTQNVAAGKNQAITIPVNASDIDGDTLSFTVSANPSSGTVTQSPTDSNKFIYTPNNGFSGNDSFTVEVSDQNGGIRSQTITVAVSGNTPPTVEAIQSITTNEDQAFDGNVSATDPNGDSLSYQITSAPSHGNVVLGQGGNFQYTPNENYFGSDSFSVQVNDGNGGIKTQQINVTVNAVNDKPDVDAEQDVNAVEGAEANITVSATDIEGDTLSYTVASNPSNGTVSNNGGGNFTYTPTSSNFSGIDTFNVDVSDGNGGTSTQKINIIVSPINHNPELLDNDGNGNPATQSLTSNHNTPASFTVSASDSDNNPLNYGVNAPQNGIVVPGNSAGTFTYRPNMGFSGTDAFTVTVSDGNGGTVQQTINVSVADTSGEDHDLIPLPGSYTGTDDADTISGVVATSGNTLNDNDDLDGAGGFDRLVLDMRTDFAGFAAAGALGPLTPAGGMSDIESLEITNNQGSITVFDGTRSSGIQYIKLDANDQDFTFTDLNDTNLVFEISDADGKEGAPPTTLNYTLNFATSVNNGEDDALTLVLNDVGFRNQSNLDAYGKLIPNNGIRVTTQSAGMPSYDIEHLTLIARAGANQENFIDLTGFYGSTAKTDGIQTLTISGSGNLDNRADQWLDANTSTPSTPSPKFNNLSQVDASTALGNLNLDVTGAASAPAMQSLKAGFGDDVIIAGANIRSTTLLDGGDGKDLLRITDVDDVSGANSATLTPNMRGFETLDLVLTPVTGLPTTLTNLTLSAAKTEGLETLQISNAVGIDNDLTKVFNTTIRDLSGQALELKFLETIGSSYTGNDKYTVQDSGDLTITTVTQNNNSTGTFADNVTAIAAPKVMINIGDDTIYTGTVTANAADSASISLGSGGALSDATLSVTSAKNIAIDGATDTAITNLKLEGQNVSDLTITGSVIINGLNSSSNLNSLSAITSTSLGGIDLTGLPPTPPSFAFGSFAKDVSINAEKSVVATGTGFGLKADIDNFNSGNGSATILGSKVLNNEVSIGAGRNQIDVITGSGVDTITINELFENSDGAQINVDLGLGGGDKLVLAAGNNKIDNLNLSGVEFVQAGNPGDMLEVNASSVSGQPVSFVDFAETTFLGTSGNDTIDMQLVSHGTVLFGGATLNTIKGLAGADTIIGTDGDDVINGGTGMDTLTGRQGNNTYVFNTGDIVAGEVVNFNDSIVDQETLRIASSTDFSLLNGGSSPLELVDAISIAEGQTATFRVAQLSGPNTAPVVSGSTGGDDEVLEILGTSGADEIILDELRFSISAVAPVEVAVNGGLGADTIEGRTGIDNHYVFNTGDVAVGEEIDFGTLNDTFIVETTTDFRAINGSNSLLVGLDTIDLEQSQGASFNSSQLSGLTLNILGHGNNGGENLTIYGNITADTINLANVTVDSDDVTVFIYGLEDDDIITGTNGNDVIEGAGGLDLMTGGKGADSYTGGANSDTFIHQKGDGVAHTAARDLGNNGIDDGDEIGFGNGIDKILDFQDGIDFIDLDVARADLHDDSATFDFDLANFGITDDGYVVLRGNFDGTDDDVFYVNSNGNDLLFAFDANAQTNPDPSINTVSVEFIGLMGAGAISFDHNDIIA